MDDFLEKRQKSTAMQHWQLRQGFPGFSSSQYPGPLALGMVSYNLSFDTPPDSTNGGANTLKTNLVTVMFKLRRTI